MPKKLSLITFILILMLKISAQDFAIIPKPMEMSAGSGFFVLDKNCSLLYDAGNGEVARIAGFFNDYLEKMYGFKISSGG